MGIFSTSQFPLRVTRPEWDMELEHETYNRHFENEK